MESNLKRWGILLGYWAVQAVVLVVSAALFYGSTGDGHWELRPASDYLEWLGDSDIQQLVWIWVPLLTGLQCIFVLPVQLRLRTRQRGKSVYAAMAAAGTLIALLLVGFVAAVSELVVLYDLVPEANWSWPAVWVGLGLSWAVFSTLLVRYARRSTLDNDEMLTRVARLVFAGTVIETAALIPIDVMVRRKADCYCWAGSLIALILSGAIGIVVAGPAVLLPLFAPRPAWLRGGRCAWCGYSRAGLPGIAACPECGREPQPS